jgi:predicted MFS family arabinose efflux permease
MNQGIQIKAAGIGLGISVLLTVFLFINREAVSSHPWDTEETLGLPTYAEGNGGRTAVIADSEKSVVVLNPEKELIYRINAAPRQAKRFSAAKFVALDEENNLYLLDVNFGGVLDDNVERVLKYSEKGAYLGEIYRYRYINEDFILTKGKIAGMAYQGGSIYLLRLDRDGFWLERTAAAGGGETAAVFFEYPNAFRDLVYGHINAGNRRLTLTTKVGDIKQYNFDGALAGEPIAAGQGLPWTAISDDHNNLIYTDILAGEIVLIGAETGERAVLYAAPEEKGPYYRINYASGRFFAASYDNVYTGEGRENYEITGSYRYTTRSVWLRTALFICAVLDVLAFLAALALFVFAGLRRKINPPLKVILLTGVCIAFGAVIASVLIINEMHVRYKRNTFTSLENISNLVTATVDPHILTSLSSPSDYGSEEYLRFKESLSSLFSGLRFKGERIYQIIWTIKNGYVNTVYDLESSVGVFFPAYKYTDNSYYQEVFDTQGYVHVDNEVTSEGSWLFVCGPIFDEEGNVVALIETGYSMRSIQEQTRGIIILALISIASAAAALLLIAVFFVLSFNLYRRYRKKQSKEETDASAPRRYGFLPDSKRPSSGRDLRIRAACIGLGINAVLTVFFLINREKASLRPWETEGVIELPTYAEGNGGRTAVIGDSEKSVVVLNPQNELLYRINADPGRAERFSVAKFASLDEENNLYVLDVNFGGVLDENVERILKYSEKGAYGGEIYAYRYTNEDFILTKGKIGGMAYHGGSVYVVRLERDGFWLDRTAAAGGGETETVFFECPNAFRDLVYCHINAGNRRLTFTTKAGGIRQYDFNGALGYEWGVAEGEQNLPWTAISDDRNNIIYADILTSEIVRIGVGDGEQTVLYTAPEAESPYYRINYAAGRFLAASYDNVYAGDGKENYEIISSYTYGPGLVKLKIAVFISGILDICVLFAVLGLFIASGSKKKINPSLKMILLTGACIAFGAIVASVLIINKMNDQYTQKTFNDLENISRLVTAAVDPDTLTAISSPADYDTPEYLRFKESLKDLFSKLQFSGERIYQIIWVVDDDYIYSLYDLESSSGTYYPFDVYTDGPYKDAYDTRDYVHVAGAVTSEGSWLFVCGPIFDKEGNVAALIETGYNMRSVQEQTRTIIIQTSLIVIAATVAFLLIIIEFILILSAYKKNKAEMKNEAAPLKAGPLQALIALMLEAYKKRFEQYAEKLFSSERLSLIIPFMVESYKKKLERAEHPPFYPELLRALVFFLFVVNNLEAALLPMYAVNLYEPLFNLPKEFVVTLPIMADMASAALALLIIPVVLERIGLKRISLAAVIFIFIGNVMCFIAGNTIHLAAAHFFTGFAGGSLLLVINAIIGAQKDIRDINNGFAHFNASYLAGVNVGVVLGSIIAQFFPYRMVYLFSSLLAVMLLGITVFSVRSNTVNYMYNANIRRDRRKGALIKFLINPVVLAALIFLLMPYVMSLSFTSYFMPIYGIENGLRESNIGQLILLNGLFAILFGTSLCDYVSRKVSIKVIIALSLALNAGAIYLFSLNMSVGMLVIVIIILAIVNIFALTNIQTYYATLYQSSRVSSSKALGVYSAVENMSMAVGPVVFSYIAVNNISWGLKIFPAVLLISLFLFILIAGIFKDKKKSPRA